MRPILGKWSEPLYALLRIVVGFLYWCHGAQKFGIIPSQMGGHPHGLFLAAGIIEFACGLLIVIGLFASPAAFVAAGELAVAFFMVHFPRGFLPIQNGGELAVAFCFAFLYMAARGAGLFSMDALMGKRGAVKTT
jgi:putative oxidoreductase